MNLVFIVLDMPQRMINSTDQENRKKLLSKMKHIKNRNARFCCAIAYYDGKLMQSSIANTFGKILDKEIGNNGFGYDSLFFSDELKKPLVMKKRI